MEKSERECPSSKPQKPCRTVAMARSEREGFASEPEKSSPSRKRFQGGLRLCMGSMGAGFRQAVGFWAGENKVWIEVVIPQLAVAIAIRIPRYN